MSLFWRIFAMNAALLAAAALLLLSPWITVSSPVLFKETVVVVVGVLSVLLANVLVLRCALAPLKRLSRTMAQADLLAPGIRAEAAGPGEIVRLVEAFNAMLERLENERVTSSARVAAAQEAERQHLARELHDEVGQALTAVLLQLKWLADQAPAELRDDLHSAQETTRESLDELRRIARRLHPGVLEDLGLASALRALAADFTGAGFTVVHHLGHGLPALTREAELAIYRVAQEALANSDFTGEAPYQTHYTYDQLGNLQSVTDTDAAAKQTIRDYLYPGYDDNGTWTTPNPDQPPHGVRQIDNKSGITTTSKDTFTYTPDGQLEHRIEPGATTADKKTTDYTWTDLGQLNTVTTTKSTGSELTLTPTTPTATS
ncbi:histidine kinase [Streptomyces sp. NPDC056352]|uniref:histidine kinase n=1 Tax=Streptomyces sp. NPDC056352 TaxID=3345791 RepID=UPI0035D72568